MFLLLKYLNVFKKNIKIIFVSISIDISAFIIRCLALKNKYIYKNENNKKVIVSYKYSDHNLTKDEDGYYIKDN